MECVSAATTKSKERRYTDNWLLWCLLLHICTPAGYRLLRDNDNLILPAAKTVRRYVAMVGLKCGFETDFFVALKKKLASKTQFSRLGIIVFDEIQVQKSKCVGSKTLSHVRLADHGKDKKRSELADHELVFMFCLFGENDQCTTDWCICVEECYKSNSAVPATFASNNFLRGSWCCGGWSFR
uniref:Transposable element P transposase-like RNase H domain-containing protein n=1 Tax=Ixodes ricinus TaxID=34613 RepID=A0A131Y9Q5_IXORI